MSLDIFQIRCPVCDVKLNAKTSHIGKTKHCPKCQSPILIQPPVSQVILTGEQPALSEPDKSVSLRPAQLDFANRYYILGYDKMIATWQGNEGWRVNAGAGFSSVRHNQAALPDQGTFAFVNLICKGGVPVKIETNKISSRGALTVIIRDDNAILNKLEEPIELSDVQKDILLRFIRQSFMQDVLEKSAVLGQLSVIQNAVGFMSGVIVPNPSALE